MMGIISDLFSSGVSDVVEKAGDAIDKLVTSDEERLALKNELERIRSDAADKLDAREKELDAQVEQEITKRQQADMSSDNKWSKNIRPVSFAYMIGAFSVLAVSDGNLHWNDMVFKVGESYIDIIKVLLLSMTGFYFGSRGLEKIVQIVGKSFGKTK